MKINQIITESDKFGVETPTPKQVARKHNVSLKLILQQLRKGIKVEKEHTPDEHLSREIALDHLSEFPDYYDRLEKMEKDIKWQPE